uniref:Lysosomal ProX carboxypeptidase putative n=1 Tax=Albugo laibachii Nc14 TaxID=890382 RepID=F0WQ48_9STRA|nr:lysosomal ProX carboxypeptidase putative [Albugo laibachii Nc14]|eukprot:CCA23453.1 lysosomal ProX carboxypeptidase putative [Albugo laibachii Nc14]
METRNVSSLERRLLRLPLIFLAIGCALSTLLVITDLSLKLDAPIASQSIKLTARNSLLKLEPIPHTLPNFTLDKNNLRQYCKELSFKQRLDHFNVAQNASFPQRYFFCDPYELNAAIDAVFFYLGNEAEVTLYLNHTGWMWENAWEFKAALIFAEHRYFGRSIPFPKESIRQNMGFLSSEQALADYAALITSIKQNRTHLQRAPFIGFGGSYGGMLAAWFRVKYPHIIDGVIAASAPVLAFMGDQRPVDMEGFARVSTFDATMGAGASSNCASNIRQSWQSMWKLSKTLQGREKLSKIFQLCNDAILHSEKDAEAMIMWAKEAFDYMSMGNYPYPTSYIMNGESTLPSYPVRVACGFLSDAFVVPKEEDTLLEAFVRSIGVYYNSTKQKSCHDMKPASEKSRRDADFWDYIYCSELYMPSTTDGIHDMFWPVAWNQSEDNANCIKTWGVSLRPFWAVTQFGGLKALQRASNIVFSNGNYDPWSATGVTKSISSSVVYIPVPGGAHHIDLFFSNDLDPPEVRKARQLERQNIRRWIRRVSVSTLE